MILNNEMLSIPEALPYLKEDRTELIGFLKQFTKLSEKEAKKLREELLLLNIDKLREEHIVKMIDILPDNPDELNKICNDVIFEENETNKIIDTIKKYK
jgi:DNA-directed RNA polymerase subunit F